MQTVPLAKWKYDSGCKCDHTINVSPLYRTLTSFTFRQQQTLTQVVKPIPIIQSCRGTRSFEKRLNFALIEMIGQLSVGEMTLDQLTQRQLFKCVLRYQYVVARQSTRQVVLTDVFKIVFVFWCSNGLSRPRWLASSLAERINFMNFLVSNVL